MKKEYKVEDNHLVALRRIVAIQEDEKNIHLSPIDMLVKVNTIVNAALETGKSTEYQYVQRNPNGAHLAYKTVAETLIVIKPTFLRFLGFLFGRRLMVRHKLYTSNDSLLVIHRSAEEADGMLSLNEQVVKL